MTERVEIQEVTTGTASSLLRRASWGAIFAGMFVTIVLQVMFTMLGAAIGGAIIDPMHQQNPTQGIAIGSGIWLLVTGLISIWIGSCIAGRLSGGPRRADGLLHGIVTWSVSTVGMLIAVATVGGALLGATGSLLTGALALGGAATGTETKVALQDQLKDILPQAGSLLPPTGRSESQAPGNLTAMAQQDPELANALSRLEAKGGAQAQPERDQVVNLLTTKHNLSQQQAMNLVNQWDTQFQQARTQAGQEGRQAGTALARGVSQGALWGFIALFLGLLISAWGGWAGTSSLPRYSEVVTTRPAAP
jgi:hypothetical protein